MTATTLLGRARAALALSCGVVTVSCADAESSNPDGTLAELLATESSDYCALPATPADVITDRPSDSEEPVDDVNWFARPVRHGGTDRIVAFASHNQNYLYNLTRGARVRIPDRSDAVATPDGRYMTVPSSYTPDSNIRFYPMGPLLEALAAGEDAADTEPAFIHEHPSMKRVYYQSTGVIAERSTGDGSEVEYRLMFSGGHDESNFRIVDYLFRHDARGELVAVEPSSPMALCPEVENDLNTPFVSKDARYVAAYTSDVEESRYAPGSSLKIFEITGTDPAAGTTTCREVIDFGFAAGKADFSFDGRLVTFHISQGAYLTPFINGGLPSSTITDVVVAQLDVDTDGQITGRRGLQRMTTSLEAGIGSYFPAFFPDGTVFYLANSTPKDSQREKRFHFRVIDPDPGPWRPDVFATEELEDGWRRLAAYWERSCRVANPALAQDPFPLDEHESAWLGLSLKTSQCNALVDDARAEEDGGERTDWEALASVCSSLGS